MRGEEREDNTRRRGGKSENKRRRGEGHDIVLEFILFSHLLLHLIFFCRIVSVRENIGIDTFNFY